MLAKHETAGSNPVIRSKMKNTSRIGNVAVAKVVAALLEAGKTVLAPVGEGTRYDLALDDAGTLVRIQCKTGKLKNGCVIFKNYSVTGAGTKCYGDSVDAYGVYCPQNGKTYYVPAKDCPGYMTTLRIEPAKNGNKNLVRLAERYELGL